MANEQPNYLDMSDEELMKLPPPAIGAGQGTEVGGEPTEEDEAGNSDRSDGQSENNDEADSGANSDAGGNRKGTGETPPETGQEGSEDEQEGEEGQDAKAGANPPGEPGAAGKKENVGKSKPNQKDGKPAGDQKDGSGGETDPKNPSGDGKDAKKGDGESTKDQNNQGDQKTPVEGAKAPSTPEEYKAAYETIMAPFKANGRMHQPKSLNDAIALMQMGANYNRRMAGLKPHLKLLKTLEHHQLLDEEKINFLVDVSKGTPEAISKLIKDRNLDPMELDSAKADGYKQSHRPVSDQEIQLDNVLDDLKAKGGQHYNRLVTVLADDLDDASKVIVGNNPSVLNVLHEHMENGVYDIVKAEVDNERMLGRLTDLSDLAAYKQVGDALDAA
ncbi:MAG: hypothetical protein E6R03_07550 [Hyphomicrobiaceae bacterium]|nr:MAG: hypothetical protein E6R03_07550 [Hyphomicrobiaceae bacterium]